MQKYKLSASILLLLALIMGAALLPSSSRADVADNDNHAQIHLIESAAHFTPGETYRLGVAFEMEPEWHIYWRYGGETGLPPSFVWDLPQDFQTPQMAWPAPELISLNGLINYGFHDEAIIFADINIPQDYTGESLKIDLALEWLICKDICIPEFGSYSITLASANSAENGTFTADSRIEKFEALLPKTFTGETSFVAQDFSFEVVLKPDTALFTTLSSYADKADSMFFAPHKWGWIKLSSRPAISVDTDAQTISLRYPRGQRPFDSLTKASGSIIIVDEAGNSNYEVMGPIIKNAAGSASEFLAQLPTTQNVEAALPEDLQKTALNITLLKALIFAFIGGIILNLMPCVFPILSLKALSLINASQKENKVAILGGLAYSSGVILSFIAIAALMIALQSTGAQIGWGFQLQNRTVLYVLTLLIFAIGLSLIGTLRIDHLLPQSITGLGQKQSSAGGLTGSFFTGLLATLVAAPCTAPFMAGALGFAATQPPLQSLSIFAVLGAGLAFPYMLLTMVPPLRRILPRPGAWMEGFRQFLAFPMFATALWLGLTLVKQDDYMLLTPMLSAVLVLSFAVWLFERKPQMLATRLLRKLLLVISVFLLVLTPLDLGTTSPMPEAVPLATIENTAVIDKDMHYKFTQADLNIALLEMPNQPIFVYLTADWCITCKVNERRVLSTDKVHALFAANNTKIFKGDWTKRNADITQYLKSFNRNGVPLYIYYGPASAQTGKRPEPVLLPQLLTFGHLKNLF